MTRSSLRIASALLEIKAVNLSASDPYTWASGLRSPIYCDNRMTLGYPDLRNEIAESFEEIARNKYPDLEVVAGTATAGIPHASFLATRLNKPMCYVRSSAKAHGRQNLIEGPLPGGSSVLVVEDLISTGMSSLKAVDAVREAGGVVVGVVAIFSYGFPSAAQAFKDAEVSVNTLTDYSALLEAAQDKELISTQEARLLAEWRTNPEEWGKQFE